MQLSIHHLNTQQLVTYGIIYVVCACLVYIVMKKRAGDELPSSVIDGIFGLMVGVAILIVGLSYLRPDVM
jgi:uncharacterized membrane protein